MDDRIPSGAYAAELIFGEKIPKCRQCGLVGTLTHLPASAAFVCGECGRLEASENLLLVPKDERVREAMGDG